ncbi:MAG TPA: NAD(P)-binding domain-containing protein [Cyclobacteriaceae bacterium]
MKTQVKTPNVEFAQPTSNGTGYKDTAPYEISTIVIGAGQAGLSVGYHLSRLGLPFVILDAGERIGDAWRHRWDSLRLFTPAAYDGLHGMPFPAPPHYFPTKDEMADYLETYAKKFDLPVRLGMRVDRLTKENGRFVVTAGNHRFEADNVVVAMSSYQQPKIPDFAGELDPEIVQMHSADYRNPSQLRAGDVLLVGAGNSGSEIAMELSRTHRVWMSGRDTGHVPFRIQTRAARYLFMPIVLKFVFHRILTINTFIGRADRRKKLNVGGPLIRVKPKDLIAAGVKRAPRMTGIHDGKPVLENGRVLDVSNVIWCTGFHPGFSWINLPIHGEVEPKHKGGIVESEPGLYFVGLHFLYAMSSTMVQGVGRDAKRIAKAIWARIGRMSASR